MKIDRADINLFLIIIPIASASALGIIVDYQYSNRVSLSFEWRTPIPMAMKQFLILIF